MGCRDHPESEYDLFFEQKHNFYDLYKQKIKFIPYHSITSVILSYTILVYFLAKQKFCWIQKKLLGKV